MIEIKDCKLLQKNSGRLDIENILIIADLFRQNISVPEWELLGGGRKGIPFAPFNSLKPFYSRSIWIKKSHSDASTKAPEGYNILDVRWMPEYCLSNLYDGGKVSKDQTFAYMEYDPENYSTTWELRLVAIDSANHRLLIWDPKEKIWVKFGFATDPVNDAFLHFLRAWIDW